MLTKHDDLLTFKPASDDSALATFLEGTESTNLKPGWRSAAQEFKYPDDYIDEKNHINEKYFCDELKEAVRLRNRLIDEIKGTFFTSRIAAEVAQKDFWEIVLNNFYKECIQRPGVAKSNDQIKQHISGAEDKLGDRYKFVEETTSCCRRRKTESGILIEKLRTDVAPTVTIKVSQQVG